MGKKRNLVVAFGGSGPEHDVSVVSAQQVMDAVDVTKFNVIPVYMDFENRFKTGAALRDVAKFRPAPRGLHDVTFIWGHDGPAMVANGVETTVDCVVPVFHGAFGEDGRIQAYFELLGIPVTGFSSLNSGMAMAKHVTKSVVEMAGVNVVDQVVVPRVDAQTGRDFVAEVMAKFALPAIVKPVSLGSSIGVGLATTEEELRHLVQMVLLKDHTALIEPQVQNLVEYNVAVANFDGDIRISAIERPKSGAEVLDFKEKYLSADGGTKGQFRPSEGMLSLTRELNPDLADEMYDTIKRYAIAAFKALGARGAPRIDFMSDGETGEIWFNEINPIPGSYGFFLWEASRDTHMLFPELITHMVDEAMQDTLKTFDDPVPQNARLLPR